MDTSVEQLQANRQTIEQKLTDTEVNIRTMNDLKALIASGLVGSVVAHSSESDALRPKLQPRGVVVHGNHKVPPGHAAVYDKDEKMIGLYRL